MYSSPLPAGSNEHTSILESPIGGMEEVGHGSPLRLTDQQTATSKSSAAVQRNTSDRYSYHAAIHQQSQLPQNTYY